MKNTEHNTKYGTENDKKLSFVLLVGVKVGHEGYQ